MADIVTVTEDEMLAAVRLLASQARLVAEPGGAAAVAAWLYHRDELPGARTPVAVLSGGNIDPELLARILAVDSGTARTQSDRALPSYVDRQRNST